MRVFGWIVAAVGALALLYGLAMDTSVATVGGQRVNNLGLMRDAQNALIVGAVLLVVGVIMATRKKAEPPPSAEGALKWEWDERDCPHCAERIKKAAKVCKHCGRDVEPMTVSQ